jgi:hypothetical protein
MAKESAVGNSDVVCCHRHDADDDYGFVDE